LPAKASASGQSKRRVPALRTLGLCVLIVAGILLRAQIMRNLPREVGVCTADFAAFYAGGKLAGSPTMYSPAAVFAVEKQAMGCYLENIIYIKPPFYALLMWPFAQLPFLPAFTLWRILGLAAIGAFLWMWPGDRLVAAAACAWFIPLATNFTTGQDVALVLAAFFGAYRLLKSGRDFWAGVVFGLCAVKFHLFPLLPVLLLRRRMWHTLLGGAVTGVVFFAASILACGPDWFLHYRTALQDPHMNPHPSNMVNLNGLFHYQAAWTVPATLVVISLCAYLIWKGSLEVALAAVLTGGVLITPHNTISDGTLFLPVLLVARLSPLGLVRGLALFALTPLYRFLPNGTLQIVMLAILGMSVWMVSRRPLASASSPAGHSPVADSV
jgi:hypothetical protein